MQVEGRALLRIPSTIGRSVCLCWAKSKPKGPKGPMRIQCLFFEIATTCRDSENASEKLSFMVLGQPFVAKCPFLAKTN